MEKVHATPGLRKKVRVNSFCAGEGVEKDISARFLTYKGAGHQGWGERPAERGERMKGAG